MRNFNVIQMLICLLCWSSFSFSAVVGIYSNLGNKEGQGTGFFVSDQGDVYTAYHVIQGASSLRIYYKGVQYKDITVVSIDPTTDLAHLKVNDLKGPVPFYKIDDNYKHLGKKQKVVIKGYVRGIPDQTLRGHFTSNGPIKTSQLRNNQRKAIFGDKVINVLPISIIIYTGTSGGPVLVNNRVIGVLSGSFNEGGSLAWAIPLAYRKKMKPINLLVHQIKKWEPLTLMSSDGWNNMRSSINITDALRRLLDEYFTKVEILRKSSDRSYIKLQESRSVVKLAISITEKMLSEYVASGKPQEKKDRIGRIIIPLLEKRMEAMSVAFFTSGRNEAAIQNSIKRLHAYIKVKYIRKRTPRTEINLAQAYSMADTFRRLHLKIKLRAKREKEAREKIAGYVVSSANLSGSADSHAQVKQGLRKLINFLKQSDKLLSHIVDRNGEASVRIWNEIGEIIETAAYQKSDKPRSIKYKSSSKGYSIVMPAGWFQPTSKLSKYIYGVNRSINPSIDLNFIRTGFFGDGDNGKQGHDSLFIRPRGKVRAGFVDALAQTASMNLLGLKAGGLKEIRNHSMKKQNIGLYQAVVVRATYKGKIGRNHLYTVFIAGRDNSLWFHCFARNLKSLIECESIVKTIVL